MTVVTGACDLVLAAGASCDPAPFLRERKTRKFMGLQDALAVVTVGEALRAAGLAGALPRERTGLYLAVGYIPFEERDIEPVLAGSVDEQGAFDVRRFGTDGYTRAHPLLAFRCLPNMPAFHVAANFGIEGPYAVLYPSAGELYLALEEARTALGRGAVDVALVTGVAHQRNFLVEHHLGRLEPPIPAERIRDAAATFVLESAAHARARGVTVLAELVGAEVGYAPGDPLAAPGARAERVTADGVVAEMALELGPASPLCTVAGALRAGARHVVHELAACDGITAGSEWRRGAP